MSALLGHIKGAYTGATNARPGLLKAADGGVLFLDEIGELGLDEQAMLLRAIEEKVFMPVGSDTPTSSDFQLLAGTNRDLWSQMQEGRFREDLPRESIYGPLNCQALRTVWKTWNQTLITN